MVLGTDMMFNYKERVVANFTKGKLTIDTARVTDSAKDYETGIEHPSYNSGRWVIVELYDTKEQAQAGHDRWVKVMTARELPKSLTDVSTSEITAFIDAVIGEKNWRNRPLKTNKSKTK